MYYNYVSHGRDIVLNISIYACTDNCHAWYGIYSTVIILSTIFLIQLDKKPCRLPLSMGNQTSEAHAKYSNKTIQPISTDDNSLVHQTLDDHFNNGVTKVLHSIISSNISGMMCL